MTPWQRAMLLLVVFAVLQAFLMTVGVAVSAYITMRRMRGELLLRVEPYEEHAQIIESHAVSVARWARANSFLLYGYFRMLSGARVAIWWQPETATRLALYVVQSHTSFEFVTRFDQLVGLSTSCSRNAHTLTGWPGSYRESFSTTDVAQLFKQHRAGQSFLLEKGRAQPAASLPPIEDDFNRATWKQIQWTTAQPLWPVRTIGWFWVRRHVRHGVPIEQQWRRGWIALPSELPGGRAWEAPG